MTSFNYTNRTTIKKNDIDLTLNTDSVGVYELKVDLNLEDYNFPTESKIFIEAYISNYFMRFEYKENKIYSLDHFNSDDLLKFRIKITNLEENKILGLADRLNPNNKEESKFGLLDVKGSSLNGVIWRLDFEEESKPILLYEKEIGDKNSIATNPILKSLILPTAFKEILTRILIIDEYDYSYTENLDDWQDQWLEISKNLSGEEVPQYGEVSYIYEYIENVVSIFSRKLDLLSEFIKYNEEKL